MWHEQVRKAYARHIGWDDYDESNALDRDNAAFTPQVALYYLAGWTDAIAAAEAELKGEPYPHEAVR